MKHRWPIVSNCPPECPDKPVNESRPSTRQMFITLDDRIDLHSSLLEIFLPFFFFRLMIFRKSISLWKTRWIVFFFFLERNLSCFVQFIYTKTLFNFVKSKLLETFVQTYIFFSTIIEMEVKHRSVSIYVMSVSYIFVRK